MGQTATLDTAMAKREIADILPEIELLQFTSVGNKVKWSLDYTISQSLYNNINSERNLCVLIMLHGELAELACEHCDVTLLEMEMHNGTLISV